jgi:outer membrane immunogenic protein
VKKLLSASAVLAISFVGTAFAADMPVKAPPPAPPAVATWTGCYVGVDAGANWGHDDGYATTATSRVPNPGIGGLPVGLGSQGFDLSGAVVGGYGGCNYQIGTWVLGIEGDGSWTNKNGQALTNTASTGLFNPGDVWELKERWLATARGRLGYAGGNWLLYVTGGAAWAGLDSSLTVPTVPPIVGFQSDTILGWTIGGGLDYMLRNGWTLRSEFLYVEFPRYTTFTHASGSAVNFPSGFVTNQSVASLHDYILRFGLSYKFY